MIDINVLYDEAHPNGYENTLKCLEESHSSVNVFIDYFFQIIDPDGEKNVDVQKEYLKFVIAIKNLRKI